MKNFGKIVLPLALLFGGVSVYANAAEGKVSAFDQSSGSDADVQTTRLIRERLMDDKALSTQAKNLTIVTLGNSIVIRGSVSSLKERNIVKRHVRAVVNNANIDEKYLNTIQTSPAAR